MLIVYKAIAYFAVPAIMLLILFLSIFITANVSRDTRTSAIAGLCLGLSVFVTYAWVSLPSTRFSIPSHDIIPAFEWLPVIGGSVVGFTLLIFGRIFEIVRAGLVGLLTLFLTATGSSAMFDYYFYSPGRADTIELSLGGLFGILLYVSLFSTEIRDVMRQRL
jgi:hypothetical protein